MRLERLCNRMAGRLTLYLNDKQPGRGLEGVLRRLCRGGWKTLADHL